VTRQPPERVVEAALDERVERLFARVTTGTVPAIVAQRDRFGEGDVKAHGARDTGRDLGHFEGVGETSAHVVLGKDEDLRLSREASKRRTVQYAVAVAFEARSKLVGLLLARSNARRVRPRGAGSEQFFELASRRASVPSTGVSVTTAGSMCALESSWAMTTSSDALRNRHGRRPAQTALGHWIIAHVPILPQRRNMGCRATVAEEK